MSTSNSRSLCGLPNELKLNITEHLYQSLPDTSLYYESSGDILIPLSCTSRGWRHMTLPYVYREIDFFDETNKAINRFSARMVASKYGRYCRSFSICLQPHIYGNLSYETDGVGANSTARQAWHAERNALIFAITHFMPNLEKFTIAFNACPWHSHLSSPCVCLNSYHPLMDSLAERALKSIVITFGCEYSHREGSVDLARKLLLGSRETVEHIYIKHDLDTVSLGFTVDILDLLGGLPSLRELRLSSVCTVADLSNIHWTSPLHLQTLHIGPLEPHGLESFDEDEVAAYKASLGLKSLPNTLRHLSLGRWRDSHPLISPLPNAFPSHLTRLESLTLRFMVTDAVLAYFQASKILALHLNGCVEFPVLSRVLNDETAFPCLERLHVQADTWNAHSPDEREPLSNVCKARDIRVVVSFGM